jgi:hypothetical protein
VRLWEVGVRRVYRRSSLLEGRLDCLFWYRYCDCGGVVAVEVCMLFERAIVVGILRDESHAVLQCVP